MRALFSSDRSLLRLIVAAMPKDIEVQAAYGTSQFEALLRVASTGVAVIPDLRDASEYDWLRRFKNQHPQKPIVLVTELRGDNVRYLPGVGVEEVIWLHELESMLQGAVVRAEGWSSLSWIADGFRKNLLLDPMLRKAIVEACVAREAVLSVEELARKVSRDRRSIYYHWQRAFGPSPPMTIKEVLSWLLLLKAIRLKANRITWGSVASLIGCDLATLSRQARELMGVKLTELGTLGMAEVLHRFEDRLRALGIEVAKP
jgi:hypothetical protein